MFTVFSIYTGTKLSKREHPKQETPTSETVNLLGVEYGNTLALEYSDNPKDTYAKLVLLPQVKHSVYIHQYL